MSVLASDDFNRANENPLSNSGKWTHNLGGTNNFELVSNAVVMGNDTNDQTAWWNAVTWPNDQWSQCALSDAANYSADDGPGVAIRKSTVTNDLNFYRAVVTQNNNQITLAKMVGGSYTQIWVRSISFVVGAPVYLEVQGTSLVVNYNGAAVGASTTDSSLSSGAAGLAYSAEGIGSTISLDNWQGGDISAPATPAPPARYRATRRFRRIKVR